MIRSITELSSDTLRVYAQCESSRFAGLWYDVFLVVRDRELIQASCSCQGWAMGVECWHIRTAWILAKHRGLIEF